MSYTGGSIIVASDYLEFRGDKAPNAAYLSDADATNKVAALIGVGYGQRGYGQINTSIPLPTSNSVVTASSWTNLRSAMAAINTHTGLNLVLQPAISPGSLIIANDGRPSYVDIPTLISTLDANRFLIAGSQTSVTVVLTSSRTSSWTNTVTHEFTATFQTEDLARYFFNAGGEIRISGSRTGGVSNGPNTAITDLLNSSGTIKLGAVGTSYTGSSGTVASGIGYYGLTGSYQQIYTNTGTGPYSNVSYTITALRENYAGVNGGNGNIIRMRAVISLAGYTTVSVSGTTTSTVSSVRSVNAVTVSNPVYATVTNL